MTAIRMARWRRTHALLGAALAAASFSFDAFADERLQPVVVSATRTAQPLTDVVADVSIIDREVIERNAGGSVADVLAKEAGVQIMRQGGIAANTELYIRGADTRFTAVFIDGIRVDSQSASGGASWSALPLSQIERIEILRGPAGAIYGSDAVAGVIQIFTRKGEPGFHPSLMIGRGTYQTDVYDASVRGGNEAIDYSIGLANEKSRGYNLLRDYNPDSDGYKRDSTYGRLGLNMSPSQRVELTWLSAVNANQYDAGSSKTTKAKDWVARRNLGSTGLNWYGKFSEQFQTQFSASRSNELYETLSNGVTSSYAQTQIHNYLWLNTFRVDQHQFTAALERREDSLEDRGPPLLKRERNQNGLALGYGLRLGPHTLQLNMRRDRESQFGSKSTSSASYAFDLSAYWRATASVGTAFRAPTLYQRFHSLYGNPDLLPEFSRNREVGLKYKQGPSTAGLTFYRNKIENLIYFDQTPSVSKYVSTAQVQLEGATLSGATTLGRYNLHASWDVLNPRDAQTGLLLPKRSQHMSRVAADTTLYSWRTGVEAQFFDRRYNDAKNTTQLGGYSLINLYATRPLEKDWSLLLRVDNLTNRFYELAANYYPPGTTVFVGLRWMPQ